MADKNREALDEYSKYVNVDDLYPDGKARIASDISRFDNREEVRRAVEQSRKESAPEQGAKTIARSRISFGTILLFMLFVAVASLLIRCYDKQNELSVKLANAKIQYEDELAKNTNLKTKSDQRYVLSDIEDYAVNTLGMVKFDSNQIEYIEIDTPETIIRHDGFENGDGFDLISYLREKFEELWNFLT